jgi:hypothetical protein
LFEVISYYFIPSILPKLVVYASTSSYTYVFVFPQ